eukprot:1143456-Pelagomonas_calceolata.AAC.10
MRCKEQERRAKVQRIQEGGGSNCARDGNSWCCSCCPQLLSLIFCSSLAPNGGGGDDDDDDDDAPAGPGGLAQDGGGHCLGHRHETGTAGESMLGAGSTLLACLNHGIVGVLRSGFL